MKKLAEYTALLTALVLIVSLSSCSEKAAIPNSSNAPVSTAVSAANKLTQDDIGSYLKNKYSVTDVEIVGTTNVGTDFSLVEYSLKSSTNSFVLCNLKTGAIEELGVQDVVLKKAVSENYFVFEDRGEYTDSAFRFFPNIVRCFRVCSDNADGDFTSIAEDEYFSLDRSVSAGSKSGSVLSAINVTFDGLEVMFKPDGSVADNSSFYADATAIPPTKTSYDSKTNQFTFEIETGLLGENIKSNINIKTADNQYISSYKLVQKDSKTYLIAALRDTAKRYMIKQEKAPMGEGLGDGFPYFTVAFAGKSDAPTDYLS